jgi:hypothetical protein
VCRAAPAAHLPESLHPERLDDFLGGRRPDAFQFIDQVPLEPVRVARQLRRSRVRL